VRGALVVSEVALSCVLLIGAGLLIRSFLRLMEVDPGFRPEHAAAWRVDLGPKYQTDAQRIAFLEQLVKNVEAIPGVESAGLTDTLPLGRNRSWVVAAKGETYAQGQYPVAFPRLVDAGYIRTMKIPLRAGREFTEQDTADAKKVVVINETMAHRLWPGRNAIGQIAMIDGSEWQVAGVVGDVRHSALDEQSGMEMYLLMAQIGPGAADMVVRATLPIESLVPSVRAVLGKADPDLPSTAFQTLDGIVDRAVSPKRFVTMILGGFAALALVMASLGIYGVISYSVNQRTSEIGIRMALGAQSFTVLRMVVGQGMKMALAGVAAGLVTALALTRLMSSLLFGVKATDPLTFGGISVLLVLVALLACYVPAQRATKVDAMVALRYE
ncbi:MAG TPA: FtsX-like permease family protein, partial [Blastocatellia bacterium]|nr:FtsX-like permease family protein [Blastocatellia bacterium]